MSSTNEGIVILGVPRSGTTLLRRLLNAHENIVSPGETFLLTAAARFLRGDTIVDGIDYGVVGGLKAAGFEEKDVLDRLRTLVFGFLDDIVERSGKKRWAAKTAIDGFYAEEIERLCKGRTKFVILIRHGLDTALSLRDLCDANETYIRELHEYIVRYPRPLEAFAHAWADVTGRLLDIASRSADTMTIRYEDLVNDAERTMSAIAAGLDEQWGDSLIERALNEYAVAGLGDWKTYSRTGIDSSSVGRWKELSDFLLVRLGPIVNPVLERAGYEPVELPAAGSSDEAMRRFEISMMLNATRSKG
jgi:protein-tyrosine sulfotransferase